VRLGIFGDVLAGKEVAAHPTGLRDVFNHVLFMLQREEVCVCAHPRVIHVE
jgi:hypothetical protein